LYDGESQRRAGVAAWVGRGLELGSKILYTQPQHEPPDGSLPGLLRDRPDALEAMERGQIEVIPADPSTYDPGFIESAVDGALSQGYASVRWSGEISTALGVILASAQRMAERGGRFELVCGSPSIRRILDMTMISRTVHLLP